MGNFKSHKVGIKEYQSSKMVIQKFAELQSQNLKKYIPKRATVEITGDASEKTDDRRDINISRRNTLRNLAQASTDRNFGGVNSVKVSNLVGNFIGLGGIKGSRTTGRIDDYQLSRVLGKGAYGLVRLASHKKTGKTVAIKTYDKIKLCDPLKKASVDREIKILKSIGHANIIEYVDCFNDKT
jgi:hypothetical protein